MTCTWELKFMINFKQMLWLDVQMTPPSLFPAPMEGSMV